MTNLLAAAAFVAIVAVYTALLTGLAHNWIPTKPKPTPPRCDTCGGRHEGPCTARRTPSWARP